VFSEIPFSSDTRIGVIHANGWDAELLAEVNDVVRQLRLANAGAEQAYSVLANSLNMSVVHILEPELRYFPGGSTLESPALTAAKENLDAIVEFQVKPLLLSDGRGGEIGYRRIRISTWLTLYSRTGDVAWRSTRAIEIGASSNAGSVYFPAMIEQRGNINNFAEPLAIELLEALPIVAHTQ
jgi:hypothetical protein